MSLCPPVHRTFSDEPGPGTFHTLGNLPKRKSDSLTRKSPVFHIPHDDDEDHSSSLDEHPQPLSIPPAAIPFPRSTSPPSACSPYPSETCSTSPSPQLSRGASTPIFLSNGKPLKSSLKSSSSSPTIVTPPQTQHAHFRARSAPSSPVTPHKNVHFPEKDYALATVRVYNRSARPAALSNPANANGDETETEGEDAPPTRFPFAATPNYEIDPTNSSSVPSECFLPANLLLESLNLSQPCSSPPTKPLLTGSILVRNLAFEKQVAIRFTLDDWQTVSEVGAHYAESLSDLPSRTLPSSIPGDTATRGRTGWDRFSFTIRLEDYAHSLSTRILWLAARYRVNSTYPEPDSDQCGPGGEWWDNNDGKNYRIGFRPAVTAPATPRKGPRLDIVSAPIPSPRVRPHLAAACREHALGLMIPSTPKEIQPMKESDRRLSPTRAGKLNLCNYAPPTVRATSSISFPSKGTSPFATSPDSPSSPPARPHSDEESESPASSTLSTPSLSPLMIPRVMISGQPATFAQPHDSGQKEDAVTFRAGYIVNWDWSASGSAQFEDSPRQNNIAPVSGVPDLRSPSGRKALAESNSLYEAFVAQWCFAQGPSPNHHGYDHGGIMA